MTGPCFLGRQTLVSIMSPGKVGYQPALAFEEGMLQRFSANNENVASAILSFNLLLQTLRKLTSAKDIILNVTYDPKLLGGIVIEYDSTSIDASLLKEFSLFFAE